MNDDATLRDNRVTNGSKIMVVGSTINDVLAVAEPTLKTNKTNDKFDSAVFSKEPLCKQKVSCCMCQAYSQNFCSGGWSFSHRLFLFPFSVSVLSLFLQFSPNLAEGPGKHHTFPWKIALETHLVFDNIFHSNDRALAGSWKSLIFFPDFQGWESP